MKIVAWLCLGVEAVVFPIAVARAQLQAFDCVANGAISDAQAREVLARVQDRYVGIDSMRGSFTQDSYVAALDEGETSSGQMVFAKPGKMRWTYQKPREQEVVVRDNELWIYQPDKQQVMIDDIGNVLLSTLPISFMMGVGNITRDFELVSACRGSAGVIVRLKPKPGPKAAGGDDGLAGFNLLVDEVKNVPSGAKIESLGGNITAIIFKNLELKPGKVPASTFVLEYPKGVDILDKRLHAGY